MQIVVVDLENSGIMEQPPHSSANPHKLAL